ncbi:unnamed protein product [Parnassius apollo]|uniref:(apollo) hypothetical protein n=1 Tax=Parnassius apollo TaxID=110799 RepID=A0A8S3XU76_PARAO|nr:unnamed protein product [Parnassius apollo]
MFYFISNRFFILFMTGKLQEWNEPQFFNISEDSVTKTGEVDSSNKKENFEKSGSQTLFPETTGGINTPKII